MMCDAGAISMHMHAMMQKRHCYVTIVLLFYTGALASSVGLNTSRYINVHSRTISPMFGHNGYKNSPNVSAEEKAMKAMELIIALGV